jgi:hypothetical protein
MIDPRQFQKMQSKDKAVLVADPDNGTTAVMVTYTYLDKEGNETTQIERSTLEEITRVLAETNNDLEALQDLVTAVNALGITLQTP